MSIVPPSGSARVCALVVAGLLIAGRANAIVGLNRDELVRVYGPIQEESTSVYGSEFQDLFFVARSKSDGNKIIIAATMLDGRCNAVSYVKVDQGDRPAPLTGTEVMNQMMACSKRAGGEWRQIGRREWKTDLGPDLPSGLKAQWRRPELLQIFTRQLLEKTGNRW